MRSECMHAAIDASLREDVRTPPLAATLPFPAMRPLQLTSLSPISVVLALAFTLPVAIALLPSHRFAGWRPPRSARVVGHKWPAAT
jgi:hypothetical protein